MRPVTFKCHWPAVLKLLLVTSLLVAASYFVTTRSGPMAAVIGWCGVALGLLGVYEGLRAVLIRGPLVTIDERGVEDRFTGYGLIPWEEIRGAYATEMGSGSCLTLRVDHPESYVARLWLPRRVLARMNSGLGVGKVMINFSMLDLPPDVALSRVEERLRTRGAFAPPVRCPSCGYDLRATPERCPECGTRV
jgi:hypothetical protein